MSGPGRIEECSSEISSQATWAPNLCLTKSPVVISAASLFGVLFHSSVLLEKWVSLCLTSLPPWVWWEERLVNVASSQGFSQNHLSVLAGAQHVLYPIPNFPLPSFPQHFPAPSHSIANYSWVIGLQFSTWIRIFLGSIHQAFDSSRVQAE